jgi:methionyl-tRNA synthetase
VLGIATQGVNLFRVLLTWLTPVLPQMAEAAGRFFGQPVSHWDDVATPLLGTALAPYQALATRLDPAVVASLVESEPAAASAPASAARPRQSVATAGTAAKPAGDKSPEQPKQAATPAGGAIDIADFARVELRVARVLEAAIVPGSDKLLRLQLDLGSEQRQVYSGIRAAYAPEQLTGRLVVVVANLAPRKMRFGISEGMVLCASGSESGLFLLGADSGAQPGMKIS